MAKNEMKKCEACGAEIAASAKSCPNCGAKNKKPFYKRPIGIIIILIIVLGIGGAVIGGGGSDSDTSGGGTADTDAEKKIEYKAYSVEDMIKELEDNAANADEKYRDQYVEISGRLDTIDSEGNYISVLPTNDEFAIMGVQCFIKDDKQLEEVKKMKKGDKIKVKGQVTDVGEVIGYSLDIDEFVK